MYCTKHHNSAFCRILLMLNVRETKGIKGTGSQIKSPVIQLLTASYFWMETGVWDAFKRFNMLLKAQQISHINVIMMPQQHFLLIRKMIIKTTALFLWSSVTFSHPYDDINDLYDIYDVLVMILLNIHTDSAQVPFIFPAVIINHILYGNPKLNIKRSTNISIFNIVPKWHYLDASLISKWAACDVTETWFAQCCCCRCVLCRSVSKSLKITVEFKTKVR